MTGRLARKLIRRSTRFPGFRFRTGRRFLTVRMDTTNRCNLRCRMCPMRLADNDPNREWADIDPGLFRKIAREVFPLAGTVGLSCGAEPFCNEVFPEYLEDLYRADVPVREVVTNGTLMGEDEISALLRTPPTSLTVSIDGARPETHALIRGGADLQKVLSAVEELVRLRNAGGKKFPMVSFSFTLQRSNLRELPDVVELAFRTGAVSVGVVPLVPYRGLEMSGQVVDMNSEQATATLKQARSTAGRLGIRLVEAAPEDGDGGCPYLADWVYIDPQGRVNPCPYWDTSRPLGRLSERSFSEIWRGEAYRSLRESVNQGRLTGNCAECPVNSSGNTEIRKS